jgi:hypothetical protein
MFQKNKAKKSPVFLHLQTGNVSMMINDYLPHYDFSEFHKMTIKTTPERAYETLKTLDFSQSWLIKVLFLLRGLKSANFEHFQDHFCLLADDPPQEIVLGLVACPWQVKGNVLHMSKSEYLNFTDCGYAKMAWNFAFQSMGNETQVSTETRVLCTDAVSKTKFRFYWFFIKPFSGLIRIEMLRILRKHLEQV